MSNIKIFSKYLSTAVLGRLIFPGTLCLCLNNDRQNKMLSRILYQISHSR